MSHRASRLAGILVSIGISGLLLPVNAADRRVSKKSQAAYQRGVKADQAGRRDEAIAAYTEAIQEDESNADAWRARSKDFVATGENEKALADLEQAVKFKPDDALTYAARADFFLSAKQHERAIQEYDTAISLKLQRTEVYTGRGN